MVTRIFKTYSVIAGCVLLLFACEKSKDPCSKRGYEYSNSAFRCWYNPSADSVSLGSVIILDASVPKSFIDDYTHTMVTNTSSLINGPLGVAMISPIYQAAIDSFDIIGEVGKVVKDTINLSTGQLKGVRTIEWDGRTIDSFKIRIKIKPLAKGIYAFSLGQQASLDKDCALYKYFLSPGNSNQHLNYWKETFGNVSSQVAFSTYCFKVY